MSKSIRTIIEATDAHFKLLQAEKVRGKYVIKTCHIRAVICHSDEDIAKELKAMIFAGPVHSGEFIMLVPRRFVILRQMRLPSHHDDEIQDMIGLQLINDIPYPCEDVIYRYHLLDQDSGGYSRVLAIIIHKEVSQRYCRLLRKAGIKDGKLTLSSLGVLDWLVYQEGVHKVMDGQPTTLINMDTKHSEICFCHNKKLFFSRNIPYGEEYLVSGNSDELKVQIKLSLAIYQRKALGPFPEKILIFSAGSKGSVLKGRFEEILGIPVKVLGSLGDIPCVPVVHKEILRRQRSCSLMASLGLLLSDTKNPVNLTPGEICTTKQIRVQRYRLIKFVCLLFITGVLGVSGQFMDIYKKASHLRSLKSEVDRLETPLNGAREKIRFVEFFDQKTEQYDFIPDLIDELNRLTPESISFRVLSLDKQGGLTIQGYARTHAGINDFQRRLVQSSRFHDVDLKFATKRKIANMDVMDFKLASKLNDGKMTGD